VQTSTADRLVPVRPRLTKGDVADSTPPPADLALPHVAGWPLSVVRCPERLDEGWFYQRHCAAGMPASVRRA
jgi:bifunctional non-homologous end joining protein LigD